MSGILRLESLTKGNTLKQGDKTPLKYRLFDADGEQLDIAGKSAKVRLVYPDFLTIGYEKDGLTVAQDDTVTFTIDSVIPSRIYHVEIIVDEKFIFPSRADESKFTVDKSSLGTEANIIEIVGVDAVVRKAVDLINEDPNLIIDEDKLVGDIISNTGIGSIEEYYQQFNDVITDLSVEKDYHSLPEISAARGGENTLGERLDKEHNEVTAQLAQKATKGEIGLNDLNKNITQFDETWFTDTVKQQWTGDTPVNATPPNKGVTRAKLANNAVGINQSDFINVSSNLFDKSSAIDGYSLDVNTGELIPNTNACASDLIEVNPTTDYTGAHITRVHYYDENRNWLYQDGTTEDVINVVTPDNGFYVKLSMTLNDKESAQLNEGNTLLEYEPFYSKLSENITLSDIPNGIVTTNKIQNNAVGVKQTNLFNVSTNLFNPNTITDRHSLDVSTGELTPNSRSCVSDYIDIYPNTDYTSNKVSRMHFFNEEKEWILQEGTSEDVLTKKSPNNAVYIRLVMLRDNRDIAQLNEGDSILPYEPYYVHLKNNFIDQPTSENNIREYDRLFINGNTDGYYEANNMPDMSASGEVVLQDMTSTELISLYDNLMANYPHYITKTKLGEDGLGESIYRYDLKPEPVPNDENKTKFPKMILITGVHGSEKAGVYSQYLAMKEICENWKQDELLETLRWNVHFVTIPLVNNYGFNNWTRQNENGVDIERNFPEGWQLGSDPTANTYGGEEPLSEKGAQCVYDLINENKDAIYFGSFHNFSTPSIDSDFVWVPAGTKLQVNLGKHLVSRLSRKWKEKYSWLPQDETTYVGYADNGVQGGTSSNYAVSQGIQGGTFEICRRHYLEPSGSTYNSTVFTLGVEAFINWLILNLKNNVAFYNNR